MQHTLSVLKTTLLSCLVILLAVSSPVAVFAASETQECVAPSASTPGVHQPVGSDAAAYKYNCDSKLWENEHYTFSTVTGEITAKDPTVYTYNGGTGQWDFTTWVYNSPSSKYVPWVQSVKTPPAGAQTIGGPPAPAPSSQSNSAAGPSSANAQVSVDPATGSATSSSSATLDTATINAIANILHSKATTGDAKVVQNTLAGAAASGNAEAIANIVNMLQTTSNAFNDLSDLVTFISNIDGDVLGDILLDPSQIAATMDKAKSAADKTTINNSTENQINNNVNLDAQSGNAEVSQNTTAGDATSGTAKAVANIVNVINSAITAGKSFLGVININGNLNGDILLPADFADQLLAANVPTTTINTAQLLNSSSSQANVNNTGINNNLNAQASSGSANVDKNTTAGNALTGDANTNITAFNLTGSNVIGKNSILVFVNVLGKWTGLIVNAPAGTSAAQLGGGITQRLQNNSNTSNTTNNKINNNVSVGANSGNANVHENTTAGNAASGNADAAINVLNIANSEMSFSDWMGILFINVFGNWNGSFGMDTDAGNLPDTPSAGGTQEFPAQVFRFAPAQQSAATSTSQATNTSAQNTTQPPSEQHKQQATLGVTDTQNGTPVAPLKTSMISRWIVPLVFTGVSGLALLAAEFITNRRKGKALRAIKQIPQVVRPMHT